MPQDQLPPLPQTSTPQNTNSGLPPLPSQPIPTIYSQNPTQQFTPPVQVSATPQPIGDVVNPNPAPQITTNSQTQGFSGKYIFLLIIIALLIAAIVGTILYLNWNK